MASALVVRREHVSSRTAGDALLVSLSVVHAALLMLAPSVPLIALGLWWNANTVAHNFIHRPFFRPRPVNRIYSVFLSLVLGIPQSIWRARHLRHHAETPASRGGHDGIDPVAHPARSRSELRLRHGLQTAIELGSIAALWLVLAFLAPAFFLSVYLPGWAIGLVLCQLQGHYEHAAGTTSHYGRLYNWLFFNDGYHVEHHLRPGAHWTELTRVAPARTRASRWPPVLRWLDTCSLVGLERLVVRSPALQRFVTDVHERAMRRALAGAGPIDRVLIVGGGLFPRTAIVLRRILPAARLTIVDARADHLAIARPFLDDDVALQEGEWTPGTRHDADLIVVPLAFVGDRQQVIASPPARTVLIHTWIWSSTPGIVISWLLLKKVCLIAPAPPR